MTFKSDGKSSSSSSETISEKFTQRPKDEDTHYEEHDQTETLDYKKNQLDYRVYFAFGVLGIFIISYVFTSTKTQDMLDYERDRTLAEQQQQLRRQNQEKSPFDEA